MTKVTLDYTVPANTHFSRVVSLNLYMSWTHASLSHDVAQTLCSALLSGRMFSIHGNTPLWRPADSGNLHI